MPLNKSVACGRISIAIFLGCLSGCFNPSPDPSKSSPNQQVLTDAPVNSGILTAVSDEDIIKEQEQKKAELPLLEKQVDRLQSMKPASVSWVQEVEGIAKSLRNQPASEEKRRIQAKLSALLSPQIVRISTEMLDKGTKEWGADLHGRLLDNDIDATVTVRRQKGKYVAVIESDFMTQLLAHQMATEGKVLEVAKGAGVDKVVFKNGDSGVTWWNATEGSDAARASIKEAYETKWGLR